ncbi:hypothetical protein LIER_14624 [Lithospermum erythrorhizon]|uniref:Uncharacterized protein n=1 Tax=Lithospermum erythrorhizon TaxID=34254 RepID=A0AAV3Q271_LITER
MCTNFTNINKACLKDCYPLPNIDRMVNSSAGYKMGTGVCPSSRPSTRGESLNGFRSVKKHFQELKAYLQSPQLLARPIAGDVLQPHK